MKSRLGKGLEALFQTQLETDVPQLMELDITEVFPSANQPRRQFDAEQLTHLAESIRQFGVLSPILVMQQADGTYSIIAGERRWRAAKLAGLSTIPAIERNLEELAQVEVALIENLQREDLNPIEEAQAYQLLIDDYAQTHEGIAARVGKSRSAVTNALRLLSLHPTVREYIIQGNLSAGHGRALATLPGEEQMFYAQRIIAQQLSVRETERLVQEKPTALPKQKRRLYIDPAIEHFTERAQLFFGTKVDVAGTQDRGTIKITYYSKEDLQRFYDLFGEE